jgi:hypothetical protein
MRWRSGICCSGGKACCVSFHQQLNCRLDMLRQLWLHRYDLSQFWGQCRVCVSPGFGSLTQVTLLGGILRNFRSQIGVPGVPAGFSRPKGDVVKTRPPASLVSVHRVNEWMYLANNRRAL